LKDENQMDQNEQKCYSLAEAKNIFNNAYKDKKVFYTDHAIEQMDDRDIYFSDLLVLSFFRLHL